MQFTCVSYKKGSNNNLSRYRIDINVINANYSEKGNMNNYFVINICEKLTYVNIKYMRFASTSENGALILCFFLRIVLKIFKNWKEF